MTGMRRGELFGLQWEDIDWEKNVIHVKRALYWRYGKYQQRKVGHPNHVFVKPKSKASVRDIDLSPVLRKDLLGLYLESDKTGLVFQTKRRTPIDPDALIRRRFKPAVTLASVGHVRWHDLRHTYGSLKIEQGENIYYVQRQMGHSSIQVTIDIYGHLLEKRKPEAAARTDEIVFGGRGP